MATYPAESLSPGRVSYNAQGYIQPYPPNQSSVSVPPPKPPVVVLITTTSGNVIFG